MENIKPHTVFSDIGKLALSVSFILVHFISQAQNVVEIPEGNFEDIVLEAKEFLIYEDTSSKLTLEDIDKLDNNLFNPFFDRGKKLNRNSIYWGKIVIANKSLDFKKVVVHLGGIDIAAELWIKKRDHLKYYKSGNFSRGNKSEWDINCVFPIELSPKARTELYVKINFVTGTPFFVVSPKIISYQNWRDNLAFNILLESYLHGMVLIIIVLSLLFYIYSKKKLFILYSLYFLLQLPNLILNDHFLSGQRIFDLTLVQYYLIITSPVIGFAFIYPYFLKEIGLNFNTGRNKIILFTIQTLALITICSTFFLTTQNINSLWKFCGFSFWLVIIGMTLITVVELRKLHGIEYRFIQLGALILFIGSFVHASNLVFRYLEIQPFLPIKIAFIIELMLYSFALGVINFKSEKEKSKLRLEREKELELRKLRLKFFSNISHEFRTPLTIISGSAEEILEGKSSEEKANVIKNQSSDMLMLVDKLLALSKSGSISEKLLFQKGNISQTVRSVLAQFDTLAKSKNIELKITDKLKVSEKVYNQDAIETILRNLIANALKFTKEKNNIEVILNENDIQFTISVIDTGIGIADADQKKLFDRFYQVNVENGIGLGLSIVKDLAEKHNGKVELKSSHGKGSTFKVVIPKNLVPISNETSEIINEDTGAGSKSHANTIMVVEDNFELTKMLSSMLKDAYDLHFAVNGKDALIKLKDSSPDLIISDVMMSEMDGFEFCKVLRSDETLSHIPLIFLTAKADEESKMVGLRAGANDFIVKPFNKEELLLKTATILSEREKDHEQIRNNPHLLFSGKANRASKDSEFLNKFSEYLEKNFDDSGLNIENMAEAMNMSRSSLSRKLKSLSGESASDYLRRFRLFKAAEILRDPSKNVSEAAIAVGFNSFSYFTKCFKEVFDKSPSEHQKEFTIDKK